MPTAIENAREVKEGAVLEDLEEDEDGNDESEEQSEEQTESQEEDQEQQHGVPDLEDEDLYS